MARKVISFSFEKIKKEFLLRKKAEGRSLNTLKGYEGTIDRFVRAYGNRVTDWKTCRLALYEYLSEKIMPATYNNRLVYLKAFFSYMVHEGVFEKNPAEGMKKRKAESRFRIIDDEIISVFLSTPDRSDPVEFRDYVMMILVLDCGIRPGEALQLVWSDVDFKNCIVTVRAPVAKTRETRVLPVSPRVISALDILRSYGNKWIFASSRHGTQLSGISLWRRFRLYSRRAGVTVTPYTLRHASATMHLREGMSVFALQRMLGHTTTAMTSRYVHLSVEDLRNEAEQSSPLDHFS